MVSKPAADQLTDAETLTLQEVATRLRESPRNVKRRVQRGEIRARLLGDRLRFVWSEVLASLPLAPASASGRASEPGVVALDVLTRLKLKSQHYYRNQPGGAA